MEKYPSCPYCGYPAYNMDWLNTHLRDEHSEVWGESNDDDKHNNLVKSGLVECDDTRHDHWRGLKRS